MSAEGTLKIRRALITVSDKTGIVGLARALAESGAEIVATGRTAEVLKDGGIAVRPIEELSGSPEAFQGRMKTLSFPVCSGILYRRGDEKDEADLKKLGVLPIDCVVVNFYPFEKTLAEKPNASEKDLVEEIDIGGPTLVRAAAKNAPDVLVLSDPSQYAKVIQQLKTGAVSHALVKQCASQTWEYVRSYDDAIAGKFGAAQTMPLRYGENPHQKGTLELWAESPIGWNSGLTSNDLSYNNILDFTAGYALASDLKKLAPDCTSAVIIKHGNPCGVSTIPATSPRAQLEALKRAWQGDPVSAFGGVIVFTEGLTGECAEWLSERFVEMIGAPALVRESPELQMILAKRKKLKAVPIHVFNTFPSEMLTAVPGGVLKQSPDLGFDEPLRSVTKKHLAVSPLLATFGVAVCRALKSNAIALVRELSDGGFQLVGAGQGQPNRVDALQILAVPRAKKLLTEEGASPEALQTSLGEALMVSDAFFPFRDTVDVAFESGIRQIVQPGGSMKDEESIQACDEHGMTMAFTGVRHFRH